MPENARRVLETLNDHGHKAYVVGGCVRDTLLGLAPKDWDICTSATPEEMQQVFRGFHVVETGLQHGTITVVLDHTPYEVTTFRVDGEYTDHRHPDGVQFVTDVRQDLSRRDFTVNAMAYHPVEGLIDCFGGREDLDRRVIRCVGQAEKRFEEDALRILRALRFASVYDFAIEDATARAALKLKDTLTMVAAERIHVELTKLLCGKACGRILREFRDIIAVVMPEIVPAFDFNQHTPHHLYDVWEHTVRAVEAVEPTETLRMTMLLHDLGKPEAFFKDEAGVGHMYGHGRLSANMAKDITNRLRFDNATRERVLTLVEHHDIDLMPDEKIIKRRLNQFGEEALSQLISVRRADRLAKGTMEEPVIREGEAALRQVMRQVLDAGECFSLRQLQVNGRDMMILGLKGKQVGEALNVLLEAVIDGQVNNEHQALLTFAQERCLK
ncbi:MAG: CCA tRNA nucleotidyltransferase [Clostridia bacterium]|nr:CCA tRNA nucleotidyltransferase [Clostridia bacterium]